MSRVVALNDGCLTNGRNSNLAKQVSAHEFSLETNRHPPDIHLFGDKWFINRCFMGKTPQSDTVGEFILDEKSPVK